MYEYVLRHRVQLVRQAKAEQSTAVVAALLPDEEPRRAVCLWPYVLRPRKSAA